jgi:hypothetical protein
MSQIFNEDVPNGNEIDKVLNNIVVALPGLKEKINTIISASQDEEANMQLKALGDYIDEIAKRFNSLAENTNTSVKFDIINEISTFYKIINSYLPDSNTVK